MPKRWWERNEAAAVLVAVVAACSVGGNTRLHSPPRFDGAGYAVLARSLDEGRGYRAVDRPDAPRHSHFPPGYPLALVLVWKVTGRSLPAAHLFSAACAVTAAVAGWRWFRALYPPATALLLGLALACNWGWGRAGGTIQSEPLFLLLGQSAILFATLLARSGGARARARWGWLGGAALGLLLASATLTRHVGVCLGAAILIDQVVRRRAMVAAAAGTVAALAVTPWVLWLSAVGGHTQPALLARENLAGRVAIQSLFYVQRLPDAWTGPFVEFGTVFRGSRSTAVMLTGWAAAVTLILAVGWARCLSSPKRRLAGLIAATTFPLLLVWPFTEAGRFLIPLVPVILVGLTEGLAPGFAKWSPRGARSWVAALLLTTSIPYSAYALITRRADAREAAYSGFDAACAWLAAQPEPAGPVLSRHPGAVFWLSGRTGVTVDGSQPEDIEGAIRCYGVAYLLVDDEPYANAPASPLARYAGAHPDRVTEVWRSATATGTVRILRVSADRTPPRGPGPG